MNKRLLTFLTFVLVLGGVSYAGGNISADKKAETKSSFKIKGMLPWHNFLCGPSAWDTDDYEKYLDVCKEEGINFIGFHNYTGGAERYAGYVEPMIKISYDNIVPNAFFDNSTTARWGSLPIAKNDFAYGSESFIPFYNGKFGNKGSATSTTAEEHYRSGHKLMNEVLDMAHERGIKMAMGFEFGIIPPEYFSLYSPEGRFFWLGEAGMIPNPCNATSIGIHYAAVDDIIDSYPGIDYIWLWLSEHSFMGVNLEHALADPAFKVKYDEYGKYFDGSDQAKFLGAWSMEYINLTERRLRERGSDAKIIIGGWGGGNQLPAILKGLDKALPTDIVFSCLNPDLGKAIQPDFLADIAKHRDTWAIPWLEGDHCLWHWQPRVSLMKDHIKKAADQGLQGVLSIHWRTWENLYNFKAFSDMSANPNDGRTTEQFYLDYMSEDFGKKAAELIAPMFSKIDDNQIWKDMSSPEYFSYNPWWGRLDKSNVSLRNELIETVEKAISVTKDKKHIENLKKFKSVFEFEILLDKTGRAMEKGWQLRKSYLKTGRHAERAEYKEALESLKSAPVKELIETYAVRATNKGDMGILVSINQRLWQNWISLEKFLTEASGHLFKGEFAPQEGYVTGPEKEDRQELCLNGTWDFMPVDTEGLKKGELSSPFFPKNPVWDNTKYKVPSPWNVNGFSKGRGGDFAAYPSYPEEWENVKAAWMHKTVHIPDDWAGRRIILRFNAVAGFSKVFVNGVEVCSNEDSFLPFTIDITDNVTPGSDADIMVWAAHPSLFDEQGKYGFRPYVAGSFWGIHIAGIWQDVSLLSFDNIYIENTFIKPSVSDNLLTAKVTINNTTGKKRKVKLHCDIREWINDSDTSILSFPVPSWHLGDKAIIANPEKSIILEPGKNTVDISFSPDNRLELWSENNPELYGLTVSLDGQGDISDTDYTRFGWREFSIKGKKLYLNGEEIVMKGDSWHFMGIPQMSRRYAFSWYKMLKDAGANAVRLHAQVYPEFYLDMADEMGIYVLDESSIWASDGGPKMDSPVFWERSVDHVARMVERDRNHASVFGWSVCNEVMGVMDGVFRDRGRLDEMADEINRLVAIADSLDGTRDWISGDGEVQRPLDGTAFIGHYYIPEMIQEWSKSEKPWGIGEMGMCYAGTPEHVSVVNGDRAFESQAGRMEGLAGEAFESISLQRNLGASYTCIFNLAWYGVQPLEIGLDDITRPVTAEDGIFFEDFTEGKFGVQPERLGPYTTTFNPGYDPSLPLYRTWALFDGVKAAFSDDYASRENIWAKKKEIVINEPVPEKKTAVWISGNPASDTKVKFEDLALEFTSFDKRARQLVIIDGQYLIEDKALASDIALSVNNGSTVLVWNASPAILPFINTITPSSISMEGRESTSYIIEGKHPVINGQNHKTLYFSEKSKVPTSSYVITCPDADVLLSPCNTDWREWNYQGENVKTAQVLRSERESKPEGSVLSVIGSGKGEIIISSFDPFLLGKEGNLLILEMINNLGAEFTGTPRHIPDALDKEGYLTAALAGGSFSGESFDEVMDTWHLDGVAPESLRSGKITSGQYWISGEADENKAWDFFRTGLKGASEDCAIYLSFWLFSPRSLTDLLIEPNIPRLDLEYTVDDSLAVYVNGKRVTEGFSHKDAANEANVLRGVPLEKGWNHVVLKIGQKWGGWNGRFRFTSSDKNYMQTLGSATIR